MPQSLKAYIAGVVTLSAIALGVATFAFPATDFPAVAIEVNSTKSASAKQVNILAGVLFWTILTLVASALPVRLPRGTQQGVSLAPVIAALTLGGPAVGGWVAAIGSTEMREIRGRIPWYGTLANHAGIALPAVIAGVVQVSVLRAVNAAPEDLVVWFLATMLASGVFFVLNAGMAGALLALRTSQGISTVVVANTKETASNNLAMGPLGWLMAVVYGLQWWTTLLFALPLFTTRTASLRLVEMREMFTQTIGALAEAVDKRDPYTARHSQRVKEIAIDMGRVMRVSDAELEALEWGGLLHDVGKIGVPDAVLLKQDRLNRDERMLMNAHPVLGAQIIAPVTKLAAELPIIRHHHEWYNGSGYPDRLIGDEIPKLARILHVADAFEAMTAARPYRMTPLTNEQALAELRKFAGVQFDPVMVDAFVRTTHVDGVPDPGRPAAPRQIPLISQVADRMTAPRIESTATPPAERA